MGLENPTGHDPQVFPKLEFVCPAGDSQPRVPVSSNLGICVPWVGGRIAHPWRKRRKFL